MKQTFLYISLLSSILLFDGCVPKVCPAYISSFYQKDDTSSLYYVKSTPDTINDYFVPFGDTTYTVKGKVSYISYFGNGDSIEIKEEELFASRETDWNGLLAHRGGIYSKLIDQEKKKSRSNYPNYIIGLQHNPYPIELTAEDSIVDFIPEDSIYLVSASDSLENLLFAGGPGYDDSMVAEELPEQNNDREGEEETNDSLPPMMYDGYVYMQKYGDRVAKEDSMRAGYFLIPDSMYMVQRKWFEIWKPKYYMIPKSVLDQKDANKMAKYETDSLSQLPKYDSLGNEIVEEKKGLFGKKKKEESEEGDLTDDSTTGNDEVSSVDDDVSEDNDPDKKEKKGIFGNKNKDKKKEEEDSTSSDEEEDW